VSLRLLSYNIRYGGVGRERHLGAVINHSEPDLVIFQEATHPDVVVRLAQLTGMKTSRSLAGESVAFMSKRPVRHHAWHSVRFGKRRYLEVVTSDGPMRLFGVHLSAIHSNFTEQRRAYELRTLLAAIRQHQSAFHLLTGDFNTLAPGEKFDIDKLPPRLRAIMWLTGGRVRWQTIQLMLSGGYTDLYRKLHSDDGYTFPTWDPHLRLDYAFVLNGHVKRISRCEVIYNAPGLREASDHFPLLTEILEA
jgi:exodeoxyribonuclease-3